ncbi:MAG: carbohydrate ABC transporter permease, partial [Clostridia bacterium]|nr:carbohydrate ABC transporter permease [Clostridia bacterium]
LLPTTVELIVSGLAAYTYAKIKVPGKSIFFAIEMGTMMLPLGALSIVSYLYYSVLGWVGTPLPIIIPKMFGHASMIFFLRSYFETINNDILEAARIDGKSMVGIFFAIVLSLSIPAFVPQFIFSFVGGYNSYTGPLLYLLGKDEFITLQLAVHQIQTSFSKYPEVVCATAILSMLPLIIIYCFTQKMFIEGIAVGSGKE